MVDPAMLRELRDSVKGQSNLCAEIIKNHMGADAAPVPASLLVTAHQQIMLQSQTNLLLLKILEELSGKEPVPPSEAEPD